MRILVINCGGSSPRIQFIDAASGEAFIDGTVERISTAGAAVQARVMATGEDLVITRIAARIAGAPG